jgi:hypothetical protein
MIAKNLYFKFVIKEEGNMLYTLGSCTNLMWELIIVISRVMIVIYSIQTQAWATGGDDRPQFTFQEFCRQSMVVRISLGLNMINMLPDLLKNTTLVWEEAAIFYDLLVAIFTALVPLMVFIIYIVTTFVFLFYTIGMHQLEFDYYTVVNLEDMEGGIVREFVDGMERGQDRYEDILGNMHEDEYMDIEYRGIGKTMIYVYQMLLGDASPDGF